MSIKGSLECLVQSGNISAARAKEILDALPVHAVERDEAYVPRQRRQPRPRKSLRRAPE